jgi:hypothetical protein
LVPATPPVAVVVCAEAAAINATKSGNTKINDLRIGLTTPPPVSHQCSGAEQRTATSPFERAYQHYALTQLAYFPVRRPNFSRLSPSKFPVAIATGIRRQAIELLVDS